MAALPPGDGEGGSGGGGGKESKGKEKVVEEYGKNRHGQPVGFYMVPSDLELIRMLRCKLLRGKLPGALNDVFHELRILDFHPAVLYSMYEKRMEDDYIYFFSRREYPAKAGRNKRRPVRATNGGTWKASGGSKTVETKKGGRDVAVGQRLTMVFYERRLGGDKKAESVKTNWGMHEFCKFIPGSKNKELEDLAVYRLYKMGRKEEEQEAEEDEEVVEPSTSASTEIPPQLPPAPQLLLELAGSSPPILALPPPEGFDETWPDRRRRYWRCLHWRASTGGSRRRRCHCSRWRRAWLEG
uniref:NAC domain-containing protein n=1 Tax=Oryza brachyantha TaxID=4533 RepID=J3N2E5_ORYBR